MPLSQNRRQITFTSPLGADAVVCTGFTGRERLSAPFEFALDLVSENPAIAAADLVGKAVGWTVNVPQDGPRVFHGFVRKLVAGAHTDRDKRHYRAEVVPWLWFLTRTTDCRIFQNKTPTAIITDTFDRFGLTDYKLQVQGSYPTREFCVQYRETAFAFVSRLMEEYGIYYFFEFAAGKHTLVLADAPSAYFDCAPHGTVEYRPDAPGAQAVSSWDRQFAFPSGKYTHTDYNFETPSTSLLKTTASTVDLTGLAKFELFDYPGGYPVAGDGQALAKSRIEETEAGFDTATGASRCSSFVPGGKFALTNHPSDDGSYVFLEVEHTATEEWISGGGAGAAEYRNTFRVAPAAVPFRPAPTTPRPHIAGAQTAVVVGPSGEEIYTDKYGRVKVQFFWDRVGTKNENSSCWIRVSEMWAGKQWGMVFTPRMGQEVVVEFLEGDPDRPLITGRVYNAEQMPPYALPANMTQSGLKTRSTKKGGEADFNELRFEDKKGKEDIYFHAQKDFHRFVENDDDLKVEHDQFIQIKNNRTLTVQEGFEKITVSKGDRSVTVTEGKFDEIVKGNYTVLVQQGNLGITVSTGNVAMVISKGNDAYTLSKGNREAKIETGNDTLIVAKGNREAKIDTGNETLTVAQGNRETKIDTGNDTLIVAQGNISTKASAGEITLEAANKITLKVGGSTITLTPSGIVLETGGSKIDMAAAKILVKSTDVKTQGTTVSVIADATAKVSGAMVQIAGSGMTEVKGGIVKIN